MKVLCTAFREILKIFMIKFIPMISIVFSLNSCVGFDINSQSINAIRVAFASQEYLITDEVYSKALYSFARVSFGKQSAVLVLLKKDQMGRHHWISAEGIKIITFNGKIVQTIGLIPDITIHHYDSFQATPEINYTLLFSASKPDLFNANLYYEFLEVETVNDSYLNSPLIVQKFLYKGQIPSIKKSFKDIYVVNNGRVIKTIQTIDYINGKKMEIEFYYK